RRPRLRRREASPLVPAVVLTRDPLDLLGRVQRTGADPRATVLDRPLPGLADQVLGPEGPSAALHRPHRIDRAALVLGEEGAGRAVHPQRRQETGLDLGVAREEL